MSISFPPLLTTVWVGIVESFEFAANGVRAGNFSLGEVTNNIIKYFLHLEYDKFGCRRKMFSTFAERP